MRYVFWLSLFLTACGSSATAMFIDGTDVGGVDEKSSNVADVYFGDPLPSPLDVLDISPPGRVVNATLVRADEAPSFYPRNPSDLALDAALFPRWDGRLTSTGGRFTTPIVVPITGKFDLVQKDVWITGPFTVTARQPAYVQCLDANVLAGAATQDPAPFRATVGSCTMTRSGGDTQGKSIASASCKTAKGQSDCVYDAGQKACIGAAAPMAQRRAPGDVATLTWQGGDVPAGTADVIVPSTVDLMTIAATHSMNDDLVVQFTGGVAGAELRMTLAQTINGSQVAVDCNVDAASGSVSLPRALFAMLQAGDASLLFSNASVKRVHMDPWEVEASAPGLVRLDGMLIDSVPLQLLPR